LAFALVLAGCGFTHGSLGSGSNQQIDSGSSDTSTTSDGPGATIDTKTCTPGFLNLCGQAAPSITLLIDNAQTINTDTDQRCRTVAQTSGPDVCLIYASDVNISSNGALTSTGTRPLAIASTANMTIDGKIDVSSGRANGQLGPGANGTCSFTATPQDDLGGGGGGAGASFGTAALGGGTGDTDTSAGGDFSATPGGPGPAIAITVLRGGCRGQKGGNETANGGQGGAGGHSGGALYLVATGTLTMGGAIRATGAGGGGGQVQAGGGGGGSGGLVVIEAPSITVSGDISANGGGGGGGAVGVIKLRGSSTVTGIVSPPAT
jgi:hypothetical protein